MTDTGINSATAHEDTIAALATAPGTSALAVIRVSGSAAIEKTASVFKGSTDLAHAKGNTIHHGHVRTERGELIDEVLASVFRQPHSYTGENAVELGCHGGTVVSGAVLNRLLSAGIRHAFAGEFTRRAFLNGKMDLVQAEAVADLIHAKSHQAHRAGLKQLEGRLSEYVSVIRDRLLECASMLELSLDFAEEDVELLPVSRLRSILESARGAMQSALDSYSSGKVVREGCKVVFAGKPNAGKSSLLNAVLGSQRAIVTDVPGTTRDYIEEQMLIGGELFRLVDTAGLRSTRDTVERAGVRFSEEQMLSADIVLYVVDAGEQIPAESQVRDMKSGLRSCTSENTDILIVLNKTDLQPADSGVDSDRASDLDTLSLSALTGEGIPAFLNRIIQISKERTGLDENLEVLVTNSRHADCLGRGIEALGRGLDSLAAGRTEEYITPDVRKALDATGEIIGEVTTEDVLNNIFARFCIGK